MYKIEVTGGLRAPTCPKHGEPMFLLMTGRYPNEFLCRSCDQEIEVPLPPTRWPEGAEL